MSDTVPPLVLYSKYRIVFSRGQAPGNTGNSYIAVREVGLFSTSDQTSENLATGSTITSSGSYENANGPNKVADGQLSTYWESALFVPGSSTVWVQFDLPAAVALRSVRMAGGIPSFSNETPRDFIIQGSNDGATWVTLLDVKDWGGFKDGQSPAMVDASMRLDLILAGTSRLVSGARSDAVFLHHFVSGELVAKITPAVDGTYKYVPQSKSALLITHVGPTGYAPQADGPVTPAER